MTFRIQYASQPMYGWQCLFKIKQTISAVVIAIQIQISVGSRFIRQHLLILTMAANWPLDKKYNLFFVITLHIYSVKTIQNDRDTIWQKTITNATLFLHSILFHQTLVAAVVMTHSSYLQITRTKANKKHNRIAHRTKLSSEICWPNEQTYEQTTTDWVNPPSKE